MKDKAPDYATLEQGQLVLMVPYDEYATVEEYLGNGQYAVRMIDRTRLVLNYDEMVVKNLVKEDCHEIPDDKR